MTWEELSDKEQRPYIVMAIVSGHKSPVFETAKFMWESEQSDWGEEDSE